MRRPRWDCFERLLALAFLLADAAAHATDAGTVSAVQRVALHPPPTSAA